jgi:hypothetical protein
MGWKGALRSIQSEIRRAEREAQRRQRELEKQQRALERMEALERASYEFELFQNRIALLMSVHQECGPAWDWEALASRAEPRPPDPRQDHERAARLGLENYRPSVFDKVLRRVEKRRQVLRTAIDSGKRADEEDHKRASQEFEARHEDWRKMTSLAERVLAGDGSAYREAIEETEPFSDISSLGSELLFQTHGPRVIEAILLVHDESAIPRQKKSLLKSGKLSEKDMPKGEFWAYYQDYVCGCALRIARELTALLPVEFVVVHAVSELVNTQTGHLEKQAILSVAIPRTTLQRLNFAVCEFEYELE